MKTFNDEIQARSFLEEKGFTITWNHVILLPKFLYELTDYEADAINLHADEELHTTITAIQSALGDKP